MIWKKQVHECSPQPNMCLHVAHYVEASDYWEVREIPGHPSVYYGPSAEWPDIPRNSDAG